MKKKITFPKNFLWGGASSAEQVEGHGITRKGKTTWDWMFEKDPKMFWDGVGPSITNDFTRHYKKDVKMWKGMGANSVRIGTSWARLFPKGPQDLNQEAVELYHDIIDECKANGIEPILNIYHFDMPMWVADKGGFANIDEVSQDFSNFARFIYQEYGSKVKYIATMNEPQVPVILGYNSNGLFWPMKSDDNQGLFDAWAGTILANAKAMNIFHSEFKNLTQTEIGVIQALAPPIAKDGVNFDEEDTKAMLKMNLLFNDIWAKPMVIGKIPQDVFYLMQEYGIKSNLRQEHIDIISSCKADWMGLNYYAPHRVQKLKKEVKDKKVLPIFSSIAQPYKWSKARMNVFRGWEIRPESLYEIAMYVHKQLNGIKFAITENGMGVEGEDRFRCEKTGEIKDDYRIAFLEEHLVQLHNAIEEGANCFGYHMWAITDNWSWRNAYKNRYGFIEINLKDQSRKYKKSAHWLKETSKNNGFIYDGKKIENFMDLKNISYNKSINIGDE